MSSSNRTQEIFELLSGHYEVANGDPKHGFISLSFWLCKPMGNARVSLEDVRFQARLGNKSVDLFPERLDTAKNRLGMRLKVDALPNGWLGKCEIILGRSFRCFPFMGIPDITASLRPLIKSPAESTMPAVAT